MKLDDYYLVCKECCQGINFDDKYYKNNPGSSKSSNKDLLNLLHAFFVHHKHHELITFTSFDNLNKNSTFYNYLREIDIINKGKNDK